MEDAQVEDQHGQDEDGEADPEDRGANTFHFHFLL
jgi:hypothetical protein